jgi:PAS domain S-box-containing protein
LPRSSPSRSTRTTRRPVAAFWAELTGTEITSVEDEGSLYFLSAQEGGPELCIQRVPEPKTGKARVHLDLTHPDLEAITAKIVALGGRMVGDEHTMDEYTWRTFQDPEAPSSTCSCPEPRRPNGPGRPSLEASHALLYARRMDRDHTRQDDPLGIPEHLYRALVEEIPAVVYVDSHEALPRTLYVSPQVTDMIGYTPQEWMDVPSLWPKSIHPFDRDRVMSEWRRAVDTRTAFRSEYRVIRRNSSVMWVSDEGRLILDGMGEPRWWQGVMLDITDRHMAQEVARNSEARYQALVEGIPAVVYEMGPDDERRTLYVSPHVEEISATRVRSGWTSPTSGWSCCIPTTARSSSPPMTSTTRPASRGRASTA